MCARLILSNSLSQKPKTKAADASEPKVKFDSRTTNKQHYKTWKAQDRKRFGELPAFTAPLIYPDKKTISKQKDLFKSSTQRDFPYKTIPKPEQVKVVDGNIKVGEGWSYFKFF